MQTGQPRSSVTPPGTALRRRRRRLVPTDCREETVDITQLILDDHHEQRRLFAILEQIEPTDTESLTALWARLGTFLELHAAAEEAIFYPALLQVGLAAARAAGVE